MPSASRSSTPAPAVAVDDAVIAPPTWKVVASLVLCLAGLGIATYLTIVHFQPNALVCSDNGVINCAVVTTSAQSYFLHIPVAILGLGYYVVMTAFNLPVAWHAADRRIHIARLGLACVGMAFALYLIAAELLIIGKICIWCTSVHFVTFLLFVLVITTVPNMLGWGRRWRDEAY